MKFKTFLLALIVAVFAIGMYIEASAADGVTPYFQVRMWTGYNKYSKEANTATGKADMDLSQDQPFTGGANMGMKGEMNNVKGNVEVGFLPGTTGLHLRHLYATYSLGGADLLFGRTWTPYTNLAANNVADDEVNAYDASTYDGRQPQIRLTFAKMFYIDLISPTLGTSMVTSAYTDIVLPKLAAGVMIPAGPAVVSVHFVYQTVKIVKENGGSATATALDGKKLNSMTLPFSIKLNMAPLALNLGGYVLGKNMGDMGFTTWGDTKADFDGVNAIKDNKSMGFKGDVSFDAGVGKLNVGAAYETSKNGTTGAKDDKMMSYYANFMYNLEKNFYIAPAWWRVDKKKNGSGVKEGTIDKFGLKFQASF